MINGTSWDGAEAVLKYTNDAHEEVYLSCAAGDYSLAVRASEVIESKAYQARYTVIGG